MPPVKYIVESALYLDAFTTNTPEDAVRAFHRMFPGTQKVKVYVADYIGEYVPAEVIQRLPNPVPTKPDSPKAMSTVAGPNNISKL